MNPHTHQMANAIRALTMDAVQQANSGHPGMPMGMAEIAVALWSKHYRHNPRNPTWVNRDRFILSNGHGAMLHYALLHLTGYDLSIKDLRHFRGWHSKTPGHPEVGVTPGVDASTGPLGQGLANGVGMALAESVLARTFNRPGFPLIDHFTYIFVGDGCLMEGISHEACSLAGTLGLSKLIVFYDDNGISIDGQVKGWFTDDTPKRFEAYDWFVIPRVDGHDEQALDRAIVQAKQSTKPSLICCQTMIGKGSPHLAGTEKIHGAPLGEKEVAATRQAISWPFPPFVIPQALYVAWDATATGQQHDSQWQALFVQYAHQFPQAAAELTRRLQGDLPLAFDRVIQTAIADCLQKKENIATRKASQNALQAITPVLPELFGGSADLTGSNLTQSKQSIPCTSSCLGNYLHYGVREFGMSAIINGIALHGGFLPFSATFLTFSDYSRNALRMAALMRCHALFIFTHDSIGLGEDGPTHQPIEHIASLRLIPHLDNWRPCDTVESVVAWQQAILRRDGPSTLIFSRQNVPYQARSAGQIADIHRGGYVLKVANVADVILIATGSEVSLAMQAAEALVAHHIVAQVVSMPCTEVFDRQDRAYQSTVLPPGPVRIAIEAGVTAFWYKYVGHHGAVIGMDTFGESAPAGQLFDHFGFTVPQVVNQVMALLSNKTHSIQEDL